jgi:hypothetical protein
LIACRTDIEKDQIEMGHKKEYLKEHWPELTIAAVLTATGGTLLGWGSSLVAVLPKDRWPDPVLGANGVHYDRQEVVDGLRTRMIYAGIGVIILSWILPVTHIVSAVRTPGKVSHKNDRDWVVALLLTFVGGMLIAHGGYLMTALPHEGEGAHGQRWWYSLTLGTDEKIYDRRLVINAARIAVVVTGCVIIVLAWILPGLRAVRHS